MKTIKLSEASRTLAEYAADLHNDILVLTERNRPVAAVVPLKPSDQESLVLSGHPEFLELIARSRSEFRRGQTLSLEEMKRALSQQSPNTYQPTPGQVRRSSPSGGARKPKRRR